MTRTEAIAIARLWHAWVADRQAQHLSVQNRARREFVFRVVPRFPLLRHLNCFEILDAITNEEAWRAQGVAKSGPAKAAVVPVDLDTDPDAKDPTENETSGVDRALTGDPAEYSA